MRHSVQVEQDKLDDDMASLDIGDVTLHRP